MLNMMPTQNEQCEQKTNDKISHENPLSHLAKGKNMNVKIFGSDVEALNRSSFLLQ